MSRLLLLAALALGGLPGRAQAAPWRWQALTPAQRTQQLARLARLPLSRRLASVSAGFLGVPYQISPLGEGTGRDPDPLLRYDAVDCLTFVEETLALTFSTSDAEVQPLLTRIRYADQPTYAQRNHLMESQWLPSNRQKGFVRDVTAALGGALAVRTSKRLTRGTWNSPSGQALALPPDRQPRGTFPMSIIPLEHAEQVARQAPSGTLMLVVREDWLWKPTRITHLGFLFHRGDQVVLRHATKGWKNQVIDEELGHYFARIARHNTQEPWKVVGIALDAVLPPRASEPLSRLTP